MLKLIGFISILALSDSIQLSVEPKVVKVAIFSVCLQSHLRRLTSIAEELAQNPNVKVTLIVNGYCEKLIKSQNFNFEIDIVHSSVDLWILVN